MIKNICLVFTILLSLDIQAQDSLPAFGSPLEIPLALSGNFAELRRNHFHTGIDIKTGGVEGQKVLAAEAGRVVRINISPYGYGKALYIEHDNGYTTVYGHLQSVSEKINDVLRKEQYAQKSFGVDFVPERDLRVEKGEVIALSGNSGGSGGPHLHFEIRKTDSEKPQNPLNFRFPIADNLPPRIRGVRFHPLSDTTLVNGKHEAQSFVVTGQAGKYTLKSGTKINVYGAFGVSVHTIDFLNAAPNSCGVYNVDFRIDENLICNQVFDELDFSTSRDINCYKDFEVFKKNGWHYHKSFREPGNALDIYRPLPPNEGVVVFNDHSLHQAVYRISDAHGNESILEFDFESLDAPNGIIPKEITYDAYFYQSRENSFDHGEIFKLKVPSGALYNDLKFQFGVQVKTTATLGPLYVVHNEMVPLDKPIEMEFDISTIPAAKRKKLVVVRYPISGGPSYFTGNIEGNWLKATSKEFGKFTLMTDEIAPTINPEKAAAGGQVSASTSIGFQIGDERSGIQSYEGILNGEWVLMEYEPKQRRIWLIVREANFRKGENTLQVTVRDNAGNETSKSFRYTL